MIRRRRAVVAVVVAVAAIVVIGGGFAVSRLATPSSTALGPPRFVDETAGSGVDHTYTGDFPYSVGGGVAVLDCDGDGRPDLYLAGGERPGRPVPQRQPGRRRAAVRDGRTTRRPTSPASTGAYPLDVDGDGTVDLAVLRNGENVLLRGLGDCRFERANETWGFDGGDAITTAFSATWEGPATPADAGLRQLRQPTPTPQDPDHLCADNELIRPAAGGRRYDAPIPLTPSWCTLSMLFSDWDRSGPAGPAGQQRPPLLQRPERRPGAALADRAGRGAAPVHGRRRLDAGPDPGDGHRQLRRRPATATPTSYLTSQGRTCSRLSPADRRSRPTATWRSSAASPRPGRRPAATRCRRPPGTRSSRTSTTTASSTCSSRRATSTSSPTTRAGPAQPASSASPTARSPRCAEAAGILDFERGRGAALADLNLDGLLDLVEVNLRRAGPALAERRRRAAPRRRRRWATGSALRLAQPGPNRDAIGALARGQGRRHDRSAAS